MSIRAHTSAQRLTEEVRFERKTKDANGDPTGWALLCKCRAAVDGDKANERVVADGMRSVMGYTVWVRSDIVKRFGPTLDDRIVWKGRLLDVKGIVDQGLAGRMIPLRCEAGVNPGS